MAQTNTRKHKRKATSEPAPTEPIVDQRGPNDQALGGFDPDALPGKRPAPVGHAPVHPSRPTTPDVRIGVDLGEDIGGNPGDVPNTDKSRPHAKP